MAHFVVHHGPAQALRLYLALRYRSWSVLRSARGGECCKLVSELGSAVPP